MNIEETYKRNSLFEIIDRTFYKYTACSLTDTERSLIVKYCSENLITESNFTIEDLQAVFNYIDNYCFMQEAE